FLLGIAAATRPAPHRTLADRDDERVKLGGFFIAAFPDCDDVSASVDPVEKGNAAFREHVPGWPRVGLGRDRSDRLEGEDSATVRPSGPGFLNAAGNGVEGAGSIQAENPKPVFDGGVGAQNRDSAAIVAAD